LRRRLIIALVALVVAPLVWWFSAYPRGIVAAYFDLCRGHYEIQVYGLPPPYEQEYISLLRERYGVDLCALAGCEIWPDVEWYAAGYNSVSVPAIDSHFGKDVFSECAREAGTEWHRKHPEQ